MAKHRSGSAFGLIGIPASLVAGIVAGLFLPLAAIAAMIAGVRLLTGKFPFLSHVVPAEGGERQLTLRLVLPEEVRGLWAEHKRTFGEPLRELQLEIQAMAEQSKPESGRPS